MLVLHDVKMELSNVIPPNVKKVRLNVMLVLPNVTMELSNVREKNKGITKYEKSTVTCDVGIAQCNNRTVKCEEKIKVPLNVGEV